MTHDVFCREVQSEPADGDRMPPSTELEGNVGVQLNDDGRVDRGVVDGLGRELPEAGRRDGHRPGMNPRWWLKDRGELGLQLHREAAGAAVGILKRLFDASIFVKQRSVCQRWWSWWR
jgi:hypothetical protein